MAIRVAINGFGRVGRLVMRAMAQQPEKHHVAAVNDLMPAADLAYLLKHDSIYGRFPYEVQVDGTSLWVHKREILTFSERDPAALPWHDLDIDVVIEASGLFRDPRGQTRSGYDSHLDAGAKKVVITAPTTDGTKLIVLGVNDGALTDDDRCVSNASSTTSSIAHVARVLHEALRIERGFVVSVHAYTGDQRLVDAAQGGDLRRGRAAGVNIIPIVGNPAKPIGRVIPELDGRLDGYALRVPVPAGSLADLTVDVHNETTVDEVNAIIREAAEGPMRGYLAYSDEPLVSTDVIGDAHSSIFDSLNTRVIGGTMVKCTMWYDNEWGYSCRTAELAERIAVPALRA